MKISMNPQLQLYDKLLENVRDQFIRARDLSNESRLEWYREIETLINKEKEEIRESYFDS